MDETLYCPQATAAAFAKRAGGSIADLSADDLVCDGGYPLTAMNGGYETGEMRLLFHLLPTGSEVVVEQDSGPVTITHHEVMPTDALTFEAASEAGLLSVESSRPRDGLRRFWPFGRS